MSHSSKISSKGQITVPLEVRKRLGVKPGDRVEFVFKDSQAILLPERPPENPFLKYVGVAPAFRNVKEINAWVRSMRDEEDGRRKR
ncbi:MAG: AbrB/MazE/SpoVT family DNA-binding domain-containing protein [Candidatus Acidiferrales bacterium]